MDILLNPNLAYLLLAGGLVLAVLALVSPGTGALEVGAFFALLLAGWEVYNLPVNDWSLVVLLIGAILFLLSLRKTRKLWLLAVAILALVSGSVFLFRGETWWTPAVNPFLAAVVSILSAGFFWFAAAKIIEASRLRLSHDPDTALNAIGEAKSDIHEEGSVQVARELWSARSDQPIPRGTRVRVVGREGLILLVEPAGEQSD